MPDEGPLTFEFDIEVRPEFELPKWKGLTIEKPVREFTDADVDADAAEHAGPPRPAGAVSTGRPQPGDYITANLTFKDGERGAGQRRRKKSSASGRC